MTTRTGRPTGATRPRIGPPTIDRRTQGVAQPNGLDRRAAAVQPGALLRVERADDAPQPLHPARLRALVDGAASVVLTAGGVAHARSVQPPLHPHRDVLVRVPPWARAVHALELHEAGHAPLLLRWPAPLASVRAVVPPALAEPLPRTVGGAADATAAARGARKRHHFRYWNVLAAGVRRILVLNCYPKDMAPGSPGWSEHFGGASVEAPAAVLARQRAVFEKIVAPWFKQVTFGRLQLEFDFSPWLALPDEQHLYVAHPIIYDRFEAVAEAELPDNADDEARNRKTFAEAYIERVTRKMLHSPGAFVLRA